MPLTKAELQRRRKYVGASDAPAICGCDPWRTAADVYHDKVDNLEPFTNEAVEMGNALEPVLINMLSEREGLTFEGNVEYISADGVMVAHPDGVARCVDGATPILAEAKTTGLDGWGEPELGALAIPKKVCVQVAAQFYCIPDATLCYVPALIAKFRGLTFNIYKVERKQLDDLGIIDNVATMCRAFWIENVKPKIKPTDSIPQIETVQRIKRVPGKTIVLPNETCGILVDLAATTEKRKHIEKDEKALKAQVISALGDAEEGTDVHGVPIVQYFNVDRKGYTVKATTYRKLNVITPEE